MKTTEVKVRINENTAVKGNLSVPDHPKALIIFSHGSGSSRFSSRNRYVASILNINHMATLLVDLLTEEEDAVYSNRFNIHLLTERLIAVTNYTGQLPDLKNLPVGYFGASTGAASALTAAAQTPTKINAIVSRGGRPDLATDFLEKVKAPTLLLVGGLDSDVIVLNEVAYSKLRCEKDIRIIKGAGHLFEEPKKLDEVAALAEEWFHKYLLSDSKTNH